MKGLALAFAIVAVHSLFAQSEYKVKAGEYPARVIKGDAYRYPQFENGKLFYASGKSSGLLLLNYNFLFDEIRLINKQGDTLTVAADDVFRYAEIGSNQFLHDTEKGYFEILSGSEKIKLIQKQLLVVKQKDTSGNNGYGSTSPSSSVYATRTGSMPNTIVRNVDATYSIESHHYFLHEPNEIVKASRAALFKWFPERKDQLKDFIKMEHIDFNKEADLKKIVAYCSEWK